MSDFSKQIKSDAKWLGRSYSIGGRRLFGCANVAFLAHEMPNPPTPYPHTRALVEALFKLKEALQQWEITPPELYKDDHNDLACIVSDLDSEISNCLYAVPNEIWPEKLADYPGDRWNHEDE